MSASRDASPPWKLVMLKPDEGRAVVLSAAYFFFVLFSYYLLRPLRDEMGIRGDLDKLPWLWTGTTIATLLAAPLFSWVTARFPRRTFIPWFYRFIALNLLVFYVVLVTVAKGGPKNIQVGYAFYIWLSVVNLMMTSVFWAFMADMFVNEQGKRLFGIIAVGGTFGAICGSLIPAFLAEHVGAVHLMLLSIVLIEGAVQCVLALCRHFQIRSATIAAMSNCPACGYDLTGLAVVDESRRCPECGAAVPLQAPVSREPSRKVWEGLRIISKSPYLQMMVVYMLLFTITSTFVNFEQSRVIKAASAVSDERVAIFARIDLVVNILTLLTQLFVTGQLLTRVGVMAGLLLLPLLTLAGFTAMAMSETVMVLFVFLVLRRAMHYAIDRPTREVLYTVLGPDEKYKSKSFIDTFVYRTGDLAGAGSTILANKVAIGVLALAIPASILWAGSAAVLGMLQKKQGKSPS